MEVEEHGHMMRSMDTSPGRVPEQETEVETGAQV